MVQIIDPGTLEAVNNQFGLLPLVRFDLPGESIGYYNGPYPLTHNGFTYQPNRFLDAQGLVETLGFGAEERTIRFSNVDMDPEDVLSRISEINYVGRPALVSTLVVNIETNQVTSAIETTAYEISDLIIEGDSDERETTSEIIVTLRFPGFAGRRATNTLRTDADHRVSVDPNDTFFEFVTTPVTVERRWGQRVIG